MIIMKIRNKRDGGAEGTRTPDLLTASQALSQLSYSPTDSRQLSYKIRLFPSRFPKPNANGGQQKEYFFKNIPLSYFLLALAIPAFCLSSI